MIPHTTLCSRMSLNGTSHVHSSHMHTPNEYASTNSVAFAGSENSSGAVHGNVPRCDAMPLVNCRASASATPDPTTLPPLCCFERPKSATLHVTPPATPSWRAVSTLSHFRSKCTNRRECKYAIPRATSRAHRARTDALKWRLPRGAFFFDSPFVFSSSAARESERLSRASRTCRLSSRRRLPERMNSSTMPRRSPSSTTPYTNTTFGWCSAAITRASFKKLSRDADASLASSKSSSRSESAESPSAEPLATTKSVCRSLSSFSDTLARPFNRASRVSARESLSLRACRNLTATSEPRHSARCTSPNAPPPKRCTRVNSLLGTFCKPEAFDADFAFSFTLREPFSFTRERSLSVSLRKGSAAALTKSRGVPASESALPDFSQTYTLSFSAAAAAATAASAPASLASIAIFRSHSSNISSMSASRATRRSVTPSFGSR
mmetsp:Transcript_2238/g.9313  ORF Transcript_2238/g.9313 Transcript_2238/m.9313 type:complete len:437 (-) Transcript_2238:357-1667(-)